ncbi:type II toxin-antitoxin system Phd/YefM family antitoxin [Leptothrix sp. BB-4]
MPATTLTSREFNQDASRAKRAAESGPVFITDRGTPAHVLLTIQDYEALLGAQPSIVDLLAMPDADLIEFEAPRSRALHRPADLGDGVDPGAGS